MLCLFLDVYLYLQSFRWERQWPYSHWVDFCAGLNLAITGANILSDNAPAVRYSRGSHGSVVFSGDDDFCGADNVIGREESLTVVGRK
ncbi:hypothetical protein [Bartonella raoultii]|uniref:Uncharacterized protein n=1 Tax=Bartonella raoultii TaxID=1457020 RepID=A0ABS7I6T3_9HYPH|nr:hypothetical protein [Bartonella raoultii]MBX4336585.1 hypothetical protein [Bartonella raoultii]